MRCRLVSGAHFRAAGEYEGGLRSTLHINSDLPFNLADLLYVVAHEGHPGHIAESLLKERLRRTGRLPVPLGPALRRRDQSALASLRATGMALYVLGYFHGWQLLNSWLTAPNRNTRARRLLTEQLLPADLQPAG